MEEFTSNRIKGDDFGWWEKRKWVATIGCGVFFGALRSNFAGDDTYIGPSASAAGRLGPRIYEGAGMGWA